MISVCVEIGYDLRTVELTKSEWQSVLDGKTLIREVEDCYEGETFTYVFQFNVREGNSLVVTYDDADGFIGDIGDAIIGGLDPDA